MLKHPQKIGILGCGHLGLGLAESLLRHSHVEKENILLACRGAPCTVARIKNAGLITQLRRHTELAKQADIIFLTIRPQDLPSLEKLTYSPNTVIFSFLAGVSLRVLKLFLGFPRVVRGAISGPDTLRRRKAVIATTASFDTGFFKLFEALALHQYTLQEASLDWISTLVALPGLRLVAQKYHRSHELKTAIALLSASAKNAELHVEQLYAWSTHLMPHLTNDTQLDAYLAAMTTRGGITEAVLTHFHQGYSMLDALHAGVRRCAQINRELAASVPCLPPTL